jgi:RNA polymerase sigma factor (sigma-70 family)
MTELDEQLVARIQSGDAAGAAAFETLMRRHFRMAFLIALAQLNNRTDAEDACQDAFIRCWERMNDCRDPARVSAWIATIVRNTAHNRRESLRVRETEPAEALAMVASSHRADAATERGELRKRLTDALETLNPVQREIVLLHDLEGWKHSEIANRLDLSVLMSRRHLSDARKSLRDQLGDLNTLEPDHD